MIDLKVKNAFYDTNGILTTRMAKKYSIDDSTLRKAAERQDIQRYARGIYLLDDEYFDDLYLLQLKYTRSVYSHETAVLLHWLTTNYPFQFHMSFPKSYHLKNAKKQNIETYYVNEAELTAEYIETVESWDSNPLRVTNLEKTIIDMLKMKDSTPGIVDEMLDDYIDREDKNIERLKSYAKEFDIESLIDERVITLVK
jgi:predicted transcriptional regulator of viral defense system